MPSSSYFWSFFVCLFVLSIHKDFTLTWELCLLSLGRVLFIIALSCSTHCSFSSSIFLLRIKSVLALHACFSWLDGELVLLEVYWLQTEKGLKRESVVKLVWKQTVIAEFLLETQSALAGELLSIISQTRTASAPKKYNHVVAKSIFPFVTNSKYAFQVKKELKLTSFYSVPGCLAAITFSLKI